ncbi:hypothetical protein [Limnohabitans sp.]|uniref:hypothetical protein n=1 Tax=Limnohabitans sp. TaxID=1907725 RepID=UPI00286F2B10|nr:hypothetical protein [Limnohabitans sp.]
MNALFLRYVVVFYLTGWLIAGCGGGGGGGSSNGAVDIRSVATLSYSDPTLTTFAYDPWTQVHLIPTVTGALGSATKAFSAYNLPDGLIIDASTGVISGYPAQFPIREQKLFIDMTASGFFGSVDSTYKLSVSGFTQTGSVGGGFTLTDASGASGTVGVAGTIGAEARYYAQKTDGAYIGEPYPLGVTFNYGLISSTASGASINAGTGQISWTPTAVGNYQIQWYCDITKAGYTRRYTSLVFSLKIS